MTANMYMRDLYSPAILSVWLLLAVIGRADAQRVPREQAVIGSSVTITPGLAYSASSLKEMVLGSDYRSIWAVPVSIPVLDIGEFAGGLTPIKRGGDGQTTGLHMRGADGVRYVFRSIDKSPERALPSDLRHSVLASVIRDQTSSQHPYASLVIPELLDAIHVLHSTPTLYIMPDDPRLGEFQDEFAGLFGGIEERPDEAEDGQRGFGGSSKISSSSGMYEDLVKHGRDRVDAIAFLQARLLDIYVGDRDRHFDQWRWARLDNPDNSRYWYPIPKDRDQAFKVNDGLMMWAIRQRQRQYVSFGEKFADIEGTTMYGRELDRRLLVGLESQVWDSVAAVIQTRLTDEVIESAVANLPAEVYEMSGERLVGQLKSRRDHIHEMARDFYLLLARVVDLHSSDDDDIATIDRLEDGKVHVEIRTKSGFPYFERTFHPEETKEVRVLTHGGDDSLSVSGVEAGRILLRVLPGGGDDTMIDTSKKGGGKPTRWYDHQGDNIVDLGGHVKYDTSKPYEMHPDEKFSPPHHEDTEARKSQTYGQYWYGVGSASFVPDFGGVFTAGAYRIAHGFRREPYQSKWLIQGTMTTSRRAKIMTRLDIPDFGPGWESHAYAHWSRIETIRFNGFGNENDLAADASSEFYRTRSTEATGSVFFTKHLYKQGQIDFGPLFTYSSDESADTSFVRLNTDSFFGVQDPLVLLGVGVGLRHDSRDNLGAAHKGVFLNLQGRWVPQIFGEADSVGGFANAFGSASAYVTGETMPMTPTLAARIGGSVVGGDFPYYRASFLGGAQSIRGYRTNRYAGQAAAFANAELRLKLLHFELLMPWEVGVHGFADAGRVFYDGDPSDADTIHTSYGGGVWFSVWNRAQVFRIAVAKGEVDTLIYFGSGFYF